jgi:hypothetical protein
LTAELLALLVNDLSATINAAPVRYQYLSASARREVGDTLNAPRRATPTQRGSAVQCLVPWLPTSVWLEANPVPHTASAVFRLFRFLSACTRDRYVTERNCPEDKFRTNSEAGVPEPCRRGARYCQRLDELSSYVEARLLQRLVDQFNEDFAAAPIAAAALWETPPPIDWGEATLIPWGRRARVDGFLLLPLRTKSRPLLWQRCDNAIPHIGSAAG